MYIYTIQLFREANKLRKNGTPTSISLQNTVYGINVLQQVSNMSILLLILPEVMQ